MADQKEPDPRTPFEAFKALVKRVVNVPKAEIDKRESAYRKRRDKTRHKSA